MSLTGFFKLQERGSNIRTEVIAGSTTFLTLSYIIFVQPAALSACGMDMGTVIVATCIASTLATILRDIFL